MGTYVSISIGSFDFLTSKNSFGGLLLPFSSKDLKIETAVDEDGEQYTRRYFSSTVSKLKLILDSCGFTIEAAKQDFNVLKSEKLDFIQYCFEEDGDTFGMSYEDISVNFTFENWHQAALHYAKALSDGQRELEQLSSDPPSIAEKIILDSLPYGEGFWGFADVEFNIWSIFRAILDAFPSEQAVILDYTDLYNSGWCDEYPSEKDYEVPKTIILTEGKFDAEVISKSIDLLYPYMSKFYSFMNFSEYKVQGSTNFLTHYLKAFAASGIQNPVIALYDNDSAGLAELMDLERFHTPDNFRIMHLPDIDLAQNYPTLGPNGKESLNINGRACSIELFLGTDVLSESGELIPVHWRGYNDKTKTYQGEIMQKGIVQSRFFDKCKAVEVSGEVPTEENKNWMEMRFLLHTLFNAFLR